MCYVRRETLGLPPRYCTDVILSQFSCKAVSSMNTYQIKLDDINVVELFGGFLILGIVTFRIEIID